MSQQVLQAAPTQTTAQAAQPARSFFQHAKLISLLTLVSRILGVVRESFAASYFGDGLISSAFRVAFIVPNLFRRLFGEGALSAAFIPLYSQSLKEQTPEQAQRFAAASVNLLVALLTALTLVGELILLAIAWRYELQADRLLTLKLTAIMLPYALLVCGTAFLGAILQVHRRFGLVAATPIVLNIALIVGTILGARFWNISSLAGQTRAVYFVSCAVVVAGILQVAMLLPALRAIGFRFQWTSFWTPAIKRMLVLSLPVALGAAVMQVSTLLDGSISLLLAQSIDSQGTLQTHFTLFGHSIRYPMEFGAASRLGWAQNLYQFPLGVFAIALATAIFPTLSASALDADRQRFRDSLRHGIQVTLWEGLPASIGLILVAQPAVQLLFERGRFSPHATSLVASSLQFYAMGIWAFSLMQILNRAYYALHDTMTPLLLSIVNLLINLVVEIPLMWTSLGEAGMAAGTTVSFVAQTLIMLWMLQRRMGGLGLLSLGGYIGKLSLATALMTAACLLIQKAPFYPQDLTKRTALLRLIILVSTGAAVYLGACRILGIRVMEQVLSRRKR